MLGSFFSGISGLVSNSHSINVVGNNISNVNTIGFKASRATFEDVLYQSIFGTSGSSQVGRGSALASVDTLFSQGSFESTSESTDLAIGGQGFFMVKSPENDVVYFTRAGQFRFDKDGQMTNPAGCVLQGKAIDPGTNTASGVDANIVISQALSQPRMTSEVSIITNLNSDSDWTGTTGIVSNQGNNVTSVEAATGKYPRVGEYTTTVANRSAANITHTGANAPVFDLAGTLVINGTSVDVTGLTDIGELVAAIDALSGTTNVDAADNSGRLQLSARTDGLDIIVNDSNILSGTIGWTSSDKESTDLYGSDMTMTAAVPQPDLADGTPSPPLPLTFTGRVGANRGTLSDWGTGATGTSGLDVSLATNVASYVLQETDGTHPAQQFNVTGFQPSLADTGVNASNTSNYSTAIKVYDSLGQPHTVTVYYRKAFESSDAAESSQTSVWEWHAMLAGADSLSGSDKEVSWGYLNFNNNGVLVSGGDRITRTFDFSQGAMPNQAIDLIFGSAAGGGSTTQYPIASTTNYQSQDGYPPGVLNTVTVNQDGVISGHYSNGQIIDLYQITLANFNNNQGLRREGGNLFSETLESGNAMTADPGSGGMGKINPNSLEQSNVDLATEFVKMIIAQRGFQANARVITTTDEMLQELMSLKR